MLCCSQTFAPVAARFLPRPAKTVTKCFRCHLWQTDKWRVAVETGTDMNHRKRHLQICVKSRFHITSTMKNYLSQNHKNNVQIYDTSIVPQKRDVLRHLFWFPSYFKNTHIWLKGQKVSSMHACMQFDVYLSDPHYTEKVAIYCWNAEN